MDLGAFYLNRDWKVCKYDLELVSVSILNTFNHVSEYAASGICDREVALAKTVRLYGSFIALNRDSGW
jgi:hypothetical protein